MMRVRSFMGFGGFTTARNSEGTQNRGKGLCCPGRGCFRKITTMSLSIVCLLLL